DSIRSKHLIHHSERLDNVTWDYRPFLRAHPALRKLVTALEWGHIPAIDLLMHGMVIVAPFRMPRFRRNRARVIACLAVRVPLFALLGWLAPKALLLYALSYVLFLHVLRFADAFQHTYVLGVVDSRDNLEGRPR